MKFGPISIAWDGSKGSSNDWQLDDTPTAAEEYLAFKYPSWLVSTKDARNDLHNFNFWQDIREKRRFAHFSYRASKWWLFFVAIMVAGRGLGWLQFGEGEFIALVTTSTATVLGLAIIVGRYLFGQAAQHVGGSPPALPSTEPVVPPTSEPPPPDAQADQGENAPKE